MVEQELVINNRVLDYKGIFQVDELFSTINRSLEEKKYQKREKMMEELVTENGKRIYLELRPFKELSQKVTLMIKIKIDLDNIIEVKEFLDGNKRVFQQGDVKIIFDSWILTTYENSPQMSPLLYFLRRMFNKYIYNSSFENNIKLELTKDTAYIYGQLNKKLNSYHPKSSSTFKEEDIKEKVQKEIEQENKQENKQ